MSTILNKFKRVSANVTTNPLGLYTTPYLYAGVVVSALATNTSNQPQTISLALSSSNSSSPAGDQVGTSLFTIVNNFTLPPQDTYNIIVNKLVLNQNDTIIVNTTPTGSGYVNLTLSILETNNS